MKNLFFLTQPEYQTFQVTKQTERNEFIFKFNKFRSSQLHGMFNFILWGQILCISQKDERTPWINLKFAWYCKIFIWLINFILITKTFFTVDHVQSTCIDSYQSFKVSRLRLQHEQSWKVQGFMKEKKCPLQCENYEAYKHQRYMLKCAVYLYNLYVCIKPFVKKQTVRFIYQDKENCLLC